MGTKHDNSEYKNPVSRTHLAPPPPATFPSQQPADAGGDSDALFREDIRAGLSQEDAEARAEQRAQAADAAPAGDSDGELKGDALKERAAELDIEGRSDMKADELRAAIAKAEQG